MPLSVVHLMRHGEVDNPQGVLYGRLPGYHLTERGHEMARAVAQQFVDTNADIRTVIASPLERAQETAAPTAEAYGLPVLSDPDLIEAGNMFEGERVNANRLALAHPRNLSRYVNPARPSWGEPYVEIQKRMTRAVRNALTHVPDGGEVLLVSHQLPIWVERLFLEGRPYLHDPRHRQTALASLTSLHFLGTTLVGLTYDEPAAEIVAQAADMVPGRSGAQLAGTE